MRPERAWPSQGLPGPAPPRSHLAATSGPPQWVSDNTNTSQLVLSTCLKNARRLFLPARPLTFTAKSLAGWRARA